MQWLQTWTMKHAEVWWVEFDPAVGSEVRKTRPAVIVGNDAANRHLARVVAVPLRSNVGRHYPGEAPVQVDGKPAKAMADQIMAAGSGQCPFEESAWRAVPPWTSTTPYCQI